MNERPVKASRGFWFRLPQTNLIARMIGRSATGSRYGNVFTARHRGRDILSAAMVVLCPSDCPSHADVVSNYWYEVT